MTVRVPAGLRWLALGAAAWLGWRLPVAWHDMMALAAPSPRDDGNRTLQPLPDDRIAVQGAGSVAVLATGEDAAASIETGKGMVLAMLPVIGMGSDDVLPADSSPTDGRIVENPARSLMGDANGDTASGRLATLAYQRLKNGDRKTASALFSAALTADPQDPRTGYWRDDRNNIVRRWMASAYMLLRGGKGDAGPARLGGAQAGGRLVWMPDPLARRPVALALRAYIPLNALRRNVPASHGIQAVAGVEWAPLASVPVNIAAERYLPIGDEARKGWSLRLSGGMDQLPIAPGVDGGGYVQGGIIGLHHAEAYGEGRIHIGTHHDLGNGLALSAAANGWAAAQRGTQRVDIGPSAGFSATGSNRSINVSIDWRLRAAGNAKPGNGPALTVNAAF